MGRGTSMNDEIQDQPKLYARKRRRASTQEAVQRIPLATEKSKSWCKPSCCNFRVMHHNKTLRFITYLSPGIPLEFYEVLVSYIEEKLGVNIFLISESRWSAPPKERPDPFENDHIDIAFTCISGYKNYAESKNPHVQLLPVAAVYLDEPDEEPVYYAKIIVPNSKRYESMRTFEDLKGTTFAYNDELSTSGSMCVLKELRRQGQDSTVFGNIIHSGSHRKSIEMVLNQRADAASIDSTVLSSYLREHPADEARLRTLCTLGPIPSHPVLINSRLPDELKKDLKNALLEMGEIPKWKSELEKFAIRCFKSVNESHYDGATDLALMVRKKQLKISGQAYY